MKKFLVVSLMLILVSGFVAAQELGVSAEVTGKYDIVNYTGWEGEGDVPDGYRDTLAGAVPVDGTITFAAEDEAAGVKVVLDLSDLFDDGMSWANDNAAHVWFKPLKNDFLTIKAGAKPGDGTLQYGDLSSEPGNIIGDFGRVIVEDYISGFGGDPYGLILTSSPIENLFIGLGWRATLDTGENATIASRKPELLDNYLGIHVGAGYDITGIGAARLQLFAPYPFSYEPGDEEDDDEKLYNSLWDVYGLPEEDLKKAVSKFNAIQGGFKLTALDNIGLNLDIVASIPLPVTGKQEVGGKTYTATYSAPIKFAVVAEFVTGNISVNGGIGLGLPYVQYDLDKELAEAASVSPIRENDGIEFKFNVEPAIKIGDNVTVGADLALVLDGYKTGWKDKDGNYEAPHKENDPEAKLDAPLNLGFGAFVKYTIGAGTLKTGIALNVPNLLGVDYAPGGTSDDYHNAVSFKIPLTITVGF